MQQCNTMLQRAPNKKDSWHALYSNKLLDLLCVAIQTGTPGSTARHPYYHPAPDRLHHPSEKERQTDIGKIQWLCGHFINEFELTMSAPLIHLSCWHITNRYLISQLSANILKPRSTVECKPRMKSTTVQNQQNFCLFYLVVIKEIV